MTAGCSCGRACRLAAYFFFFKQKTAYEISQRLLYFVEPKELLFWEKRFFNSGIRRLEQHMPELCFSPPVYPRRRQECQGFFRAPLGDPGDLILPQIERAAQNPFPSAKPLMVAALAAQLT